MIPFVRPKLPNPAPIETFDFYNWSGGLNNSSSHALLKINQAWDLLNMAFSIDGLMEKRPGTHPLDELVLSSSIVYMDIYKPIDLPEVLIRATATEVYAGITKICDVGGPIKGVNYIGNYYFVDGLTYRVYDGTSVYEIKKPPEGRLNADLIATATSFVIQEWDNRIAVGQTIQFEGINGAETKVIATVNSGTKTITITTGLTYVFKANELVRFYVPRDTTYFEGVQKTDETLKLKWYEPCDQELNDIFKGECFVPDDCTCMEYDSERLYLAGNPKHPNEIYICDINNPLYFPVQLGMQVPPNGDIIIDLLQFDNAIVVGRHDDIHVITGETNNVTLSSYFEMKKFDTHTGFASKNNARLANNYMFYLGNDMNIYAMHTIRTDSETLATTMLNKDRIDLRKFPLGFTQADIENCPSIYFRDEYFIAIKDKILVYNYIYRGWTVYHGMNASFFCIKDNELLIGTTTGKVMTYGGAFNDDGETIFCYYRMGQNNLGTPIHYKDFLELYAVLHSFDDHESSIKITALVDYDETSLSTDIANKISKFGEMKFGDKLVSQNIAQTDNIPINLIGRVITIIYSNNVLDEPMKLYQLSGTYIVRNTR